eukprot:1375615-Rhodomonas_salina.2
MAVPGDVDRTVSGTVDLQPFPPSTPEHRYCPTHPQTVRTSPTRRSSVYKRAGTDVPPRSVLYTLPRRYCLP